MARIDNDYEALAEPEDEAELAQAIIREAAQRGAIFKGWDGPSAVERDRIEDWFHSDPRGLLEAIADSRTAPAERPLDISNFTDEEVEQLAAWRDSDPDGFEKAVERATDPFERLAKGTVKRLTFDPGASRKRLGW